MKLETWLRMANIAYKTEIPTDLTQAPKGKVPYIEYKGKRIGDSTLIIEMLTKKKGIDLDCDLTSTQKAVSLAFRRMLNENTYWGCTYIRYKIDDNWQLYKQALTNLYVAGRSTLEWNNFLEQMRSTISHQLYEQGMGRHSDREVFQIIAADFQALSDYLADKAFFMGDRPTTLDATAYACIGNIIAPPFKSEIVDFVMQLENLGQYYQRMKQNFFPEI